MYKNFETEISWKFVQEIGKELGKPMVILGGWAVYFVVNDKFRSLEGKNYLGSKDLDIGFYMEKNWDEKQIKDSKFAKELKILENIGFRPRSFRLVQEFHTETKTKLTLEEAKIIPYHFITSVYIDPIVNVIPNDFKKVFGFTPIDEPLLDLVFKEENIKIEDFIIPTPEVLLAMKLNSVLTRDKEHKRIKDICDIFALLQYSKLSINKFLKIYKMNKALEVIGQLEVDKPAEILGIDKNIIMGVFENIKER